jgi:hypothetical protein
MWIVGEKWKQCSQRLVGWSRTENERMRKAEHAGPTDTPGMEHCLLGRVRLALEPAMGVHDISERHPDVHKTRVVSDFLQKR